jgi:DNA-binding PadR family transcriptional regulator
MCKHADNGMHLPILVPTLSPKESLILELLVGAKEMYGLELVAASEGALKRGTVYVTLGRREDKGYVGSRLEAAPPAVGGLPRRVYAATPLGREVLAAWTTAATRFRVRFAR